MANTLTNLIPSLYANLDVVSREQQGLLPAVTLNADASRAAVGQTVYSFVAPASTAADITAGQTAPDTGDQTLGSKSITIAKSRAVPIRVTGEEALGLNNNGAGYSNIFNNQIQQAIRTLTNEMEADVAALQAQFSRAYGTAGTTPFATAGDFTDASEAIRILKDNGAPLGDLQLVMNTAAGAKFIGKQSTYNTQGNDTFLRQGIFLTTAGAALRESSAIVTNTAGTASGATTNNAGYAVGATVLTLASAGTGTLVAGDVVTFAGDTNKYTIVSGDADVSNGGTITLAEPGLRVAMSAATKAITVIAAAARNMAFARSAIVLANRLPARPPEGDMADDVTTITDPRSGLTFELSVYKQYRRVHYELAAAWGANLIKPEHTALLLG